MVLYAVESGPATTGGPLNLASSPHARRGAHCAPEKDRAGATADRTDVEGFVALEIVEGCVGDYREQLPARGTRYGAFVDPAGGSGPDAMTLAIAHEARPDDRIVIDAVREMRPPFSPTVVVDEFAELLKAYDVTKVVGDHYGGEFVKEPFRKHGISYELCKKPKSDLYRDLLPASTAAKLSCRAMIGCWRRSAV